LKGSGTPAAPTLAEREADARFQLAIVSLEGGDKNQAVAELKRAVQLDAKNWLIRKQLWALEAPEAFYGDAVDYAWQKVQMQREAEGLLAE
jgi:Tfp pilus assembly protein PilF